MRDITKQISLYLILAANIAWCARDGTTRSTSAYPLGQEAFIKTYRIQDPVSDHPITAARYEELSQLAFKKFDEEVYYSKHWREIRDEGLRRLSKDGIVSTPAHLRHHPKYVDYFDGISHTPAVFMRLADFGTTRHLGAVKPDVAVFMHTVRVSDKTKAEYWLDLRYILRGPLQIDESYDSATPYILWQNLKEDYTRVWVTDVKEVYKWEVLPDLERLGYDPSTIEREIDVYAHANGHETDERLHGYLRDAVRYFTQFDSEKGARLLNTYSLMLSPVDDSPSAKQKSWFQCPLFKKLDRKRGRFGFETYDFEGQRMPALDKLQLSLHVDRSGKTVLVPEAIVRPVRVTPSVQFQTIITIPPKLRAVVTFQFRQTKPVSYRQVIYPEIDRGSEMAAVSALFKQTRPFGHPFTSPLLISDSLQVSRKALLRESTRIDSPLSQTQASAAREGSARPREARSSASSQHDGVSIEGGGDETPLALEQVTPDQKNLNLPSFLTRPSPEAGPTQLRPIEEAKGGASPWSSGPSAPFSVPATPHLLLKPEPFAPRRVSEPFPMDLDNAQTPWRNQDQARHYAPLPNQDADETMSSVWDAQHHTLQNMSPFKQELHEDIPSFWGEPFFYYVSPPIQQANRPLPSPWTPRTLSYVSPFRQPQQEPSQAPSPHGLFAGPVDYHPYEQPKYSSLESLEAHLKPGSEWGHPISQHANPPQQDHHGGQPTSNFLKELEDHINPVLHDTWRWPQPRP